MGSRIESAEYRICAVSGSQTAPVRWPSEGWMPATVYELAAVVEQLPLSERIVARGMAVLEDTVRECAAVLRDDIRPAAQMPLRCMARI